MCDVCGGGSGGSGAKQCAGCGRRRYCGRACQKRDWAAGHKQACAGLAEAAMRQRVQRYLAPPAAPCVVCASAAPSLVRLACGHSAHRRCLAGRPKCPECGAWAGTSSTNAWDEEEPGEHARCMREQLETYQELSARGVSPCDQGVFTLFHCLGWVVQHLCGDASQLFESQCIRDMLDRTSGDKLDRAVRAARDHSRRSLTASCARDLLQGCDFAAAVGAVISAGARLPVSERRAQKAALRWQASALPGVTPAKGEDVLDAEACAPVPSWAECLRRAEALRPDTEAALALGDEERARQRARCMHLNMLWMRLGSDVERRRAREADAPAAAESHAEAEARAGVLALMRATQPRLVAMAVRDFQGVIPVKRM
eukprot:jgi/Tetstr1/463948/TSEL_008753.t1